MFEQNAHDATFGFGVVFSDRALEFLRGDDPETAAAIAPHLESWQDITLDHGGERIVIDGVGFAAIGRLDLLGLLRERARAVGIEPRYLHPVAGLDELGDCDLIVGADGVNSLVRRTHAEGFGSSVSLLTNRFAWFGTTQPFATLSQTFRTSPHGHFNAHHYRYAPDKSTFIVEVDEETFRRAGFEHMPQREAQTICEQVFADVLEGHPLISNNSIWRQFPKVRNERWSHGRTCLLGDALHTAHFSIGSGTRLALEDAIALDARLPAIRSASAMRSPTTRRRAGRSSKNWWRRQMPAASGMSISPSTCGSRRSTLR